jgi:hypothetical protein
VFPWWTRRTLRRRTDPLAAPRLLLALLAAAAFGAARAEVDRAAFVRLAGSVLRIEVIRAQGGYSIGSGVVVGAHEVVTNCHVTRDANRNHVAQAGVRLAVETHSGDVDHDLCVLRVPGIDTGAVRLGHADELRPGQRVIALGFTGGAGMQTSGGEVIALHRFDGGKVIQSSNWFNSGASGGGLFDEQSRLVGILTFRLRVGAAHYFAAPVEWLGRLLGDGVPSRAVAPFAAQELAFWQRPLEAQPDFLKAAVLERNHDWPALETLSQRWSQEVPADAEPWYLHGEALAEQGRWPTARAALERSLDIEPAQAAAWYRLGLVYTRLGQPARARDALHRLEPLDAAQAADLARRLDDR